jgi:hypothetical protein
MTNRDINQQVKIIDKLTNKALRQIRKSRKNRNVNYISEWFSYVEIVGKGLKKHLN